MPTSSDVAKRAGVSRSTVSYVLNDTPGSRIPQATRDRVLAAAAELGYVANRAAADLRRGTTRIVLGVFDREQAGSLFHQNMPTFTRVLHEVGLTLVTTFATGEIGQDVAYEWAALRPMAVFSFGAQLSAAASAVVRAAGAVVIAEQGADVTYTIDQAAVATAGVAAMHERGRRRLVQGLPREPSLAELCADREPAFAALTGAEGLGTVRLARRLEDARALVAELASWPALPEGIVAYNDEYAALLVAALLDAGIAVPAQVAVIGVDNAPWGRWMRPALSTLILDPGSLAADVVAVLVAISRGQPYPTTLTFALGSQAMHRQTT